MCDDPVRTHVQNEDGDGPVFSLVYRWLSDRAQ